MASDGTYGIKGIFPPDPEGRVEEPKETHPRESDVNEPWKIPYDPNMPVRKEISVLANPDPKGKEGQKQWTLFILALEKFKYMPVEDKLSYFRVAGIHAYPEIAWDGAPEPKHAPPPEDKRPGKQPYGGYCNHNGLNFPTWHRPYMALFEQRIWEIMYEVIDHWVKKHGLSTEDAKIWRAAANSWRMPYWDWARHQAYTEDFAYPEILVQGSVRIYVPVSLKEVYYPNGNPNGGYPNPFWSFENPERDEDGIPLPLALPDPNDDDEKNVWLPWSQTSATSRYGVFVKRDRSAFRGLHGVNNAWEANKKLASIKEDNSWIKLPGIEWNPGTLADAVNRMFSPQYNHTWGNFASTKWIKEGQGGVKSGYLSLEYLHNNVHNLAGGSHYRTGIGHMSDLPVAAFDPIFWLHHAQVDRLLVIWQCLYPDLWWDSTEPQSSHVEDDQPTDKLEPFHTKDNGDPKNDVWTANACRDWTTMNYQYDDLAKVAKSAFHDGALDEKKFQQALLGHINELYPNTARLIQELDEAEKIPRGLRADENPKAERWSSWNDYIINVVYDRFALGGRSYSIEFYLAVSEDQKESRFASQNFVGEVYNFGGRTLDTCQNCKSQADAGILSCGQVPITIQLLHRAIGRANGHSLKDFTDTKVEDYLKEYLHWRFVAYGGYPIDDSKLEPFERTKISVLRGTGKRDQIDLSDMDLDLPSYYDGHEFDKAISHHGYFIEPTKEGPKVALLPSYSDYELLPGVTDGKALGLKMGEQPNEV
ncbi:hypothetical protein NM208_g9513 [Fusarium decemcellulare]|uniref:Uncharacterized protein n=1 Tax=Fusarium decemcellulare TaxID=57161 RepID=A0ACC1S194_9HYPO|nr:hypothetical protein NM208_g9513 [Fusarium decemcellulare]